MPVELQKNGNNVINFAVTHNDQKFEISILQDSIEETDANPLEPPSYIVRISTNELGLYEEMRNALGGATFTSEVSSVDDSTKENLCAPFLCDFRINPSRFALKDVHSFLGHVLGKLETAEIITASDAKAVVDNWMELRPPTASDIVNWPTSERGPNRG